MKKSITLLLALMLMANFALTAYAAEDILTMSDASGQEGSTVYLAVSLNAPVRGDTVGITYTYDASLLTPDPDSSSWSSKGLIKDFDGNGAGVWASGNVQELSGTLCVLAFQILKPIPSGTPVSCSVTIREGAAETGIFTAQAQVLTQDISCSHQYGQWTDKGALGHVRSCSLCGDSQTQSHTWDQGVVKDISGNLQQMVHTCTVCGSSKIVQISGSVEQESIPTVPSHSTTPTQPDPTAPAQDHIHQEQDSTRPTLHSYEPEQSQKAPPHSQQTPEENFHVHADGTIHYGDHTEPTQVAPEEQEPLHDHTHELPTQEQGDPVANMLLAAAVTAMMFGAGWWYLKKKKH